MARILAQKTGDHYLAGLWAAHLPEDLNWRVYLQEESFAGTTPIKGTVLGDSKKPEEYRAPSWSWASLDAPIRFVPLSYSNLVVSCFEFHTEPYGEDVYGRVKAGKLVLEVRYSLLPVIWRLLTGVGTGSCIQDLSL
jgi:hypothetical protein